MKYCRSSLLLLVPALLLTACVDREQADKKLANACRDGIAALLPEQSDSIRAMKDYKATTSSAGEDFRTITYAGQADGWIGAQNFVCTFQEQFGFMKNSYTAMIYNVDLGDRRIGKTGGSSIEGEVQDFITLNAAVQASLSGQMQPLQRKGEMDPGQDMTGMTGAGGIADTVGSETP
jgi:hypothetical protein